jgi:hypothetical protein
MEINETWYMLPCKRNCLNTAHVSLSGKMFLNLFSKFSDSFLIEPLGQNHHPLALVTQGRLDWNLTVFFGNSIQNRILQELWVILCNLEKKIHTWRLEGERDRQ